MNTSKQRILSLILTLCFVIGLFPFSTFAIGTEEEEHVIAVPQEAMVITAGTYYGISKSWFEENNPHGEKLSLSIELPNSVTTICKDGFRDSWSSEKQKQGCITNYNYDGDKKYTDKYAMVQIDFSNAENLVTIGEQAAMSGSLSGVLDLSGTKVETIGKSAFKDCAGITGVILPPTLKQIGTASSGSVFYGCSGMQFLRTAGGNPTAVFEFPETLEVIGRQSFCSCIGLPAGTEVTIPASVTDMGDEVFNHTPAVTTITVKTNDASNYGGKAFSDSTNQYGLGGRLTVFNNSAAKNTFTPSGLTSYKNSLTYEFTLHYGDDENAVTERKLYGQPVNVCKNGDGSYSADSDYQIPKAPAENAPVGYDCGWAYDGKILTAQTVLKPDGDDLYLDTDFVLQNPTVAFIVDGNVIETENTYPKLNLSNDKEHTIGVAVSHPVQTAEDADVRVKFEYEWTDVWKGGSQGPRMEESGFGRYNLFDHPDVTNTITVNGPQDERTSAGNYSDEDYGDGYYLLEIYGYYVPKTGGAWELFYKSAHTKIGISDPERTVDTAYLFDVKTSDPAEVPAVTADNVSVIYGYDDRTELCADVAEQPGYTYVYQWYEAAEEGQTTGGEKIAGAEGNTYAVSVGKDVGSYHYYLEVTATKTENGDSKIIAIPVKLSVLPKIVTVTPDEGQGKYTGQDDTPFTYVLSEDIAVSGALQREPGEAAGIYDFVLGSLTADSDNYMLELNAEGVSFEIRQYTAQAIVSPGEPNGENGWYNTAVTVTPPDGHSISTDGGRTWSTEPIVFNEYVGDFEYLLRSDKEDGTKGAVAPNTTSLKIDTTAPVISGLEDGKTYCAEITFAASDDNFAYVTVNGSQTTDDTLNANGSVYIVIAFDRAGNQSLQYTVNVNNGHTFTNYVSDHNADCETNGTETAVCDFCSATDTRQEENSAFGHDYGAPEFDWSEDGKTCTFIFICKNNSAHIANIKADVTSEIKIPATCTETGTTTYLATAEFNGTTYTDQRDIADIPAHGHDALYKFDGNHHYKECRYCGERSEEGAHLYGAWTVTKEATETTDGSKERTCTLCGHVQIETISAVDSVTNISDVGKPENHEHSASFQTDGTTGTDASLPPQTGDAGNIFLWPALMVAGACGMIIAIMAGKKCKTNR